MSQVKIQGNASGTGEFTIAAPNSNTNRTLTLPDHATCGWADGQPVTPYADLTEQEVLGWCWANGVDKAATEMALNASIADQKAPKQASGTPW